MTTFKKILHPTDFSPSAKAAQELAIELAQKFGAELTLLYVYSVPVYVGPFGDGYPLPPDVVTKLQDDAARALRELREAALAAGVQVQTEAVEGIASEVITALAHSRAMDLIVMGTHGHTGIKHLLLGSVAERVVRTAQCPVLTVRAPAASPPG